VIESNVDNGVFLDLDPRKKARLKSFDAKQCFANKRTGAQFDNEGEKNVISHDRNRNESEHAANPVGQTQALSPV
jgi:hypothetical protein